MQDVTILWIISPDLRPRHIYLFVFLFRPISLFLDVRVYLHTFVAALAQLCQHFRQQGNAAQLYKAECLKVICFP